MDEEVMIDILKRIKYHHDHNALTPLIMKDFMEELRAQVPELDEEPAPPPAPPEEPPA